MPSINNSFSISVVLPTYNRINRIKKCLPSFLKTKVEDVQFIIIDNNSDDGTWNYLQSVALNDKRVEIYKNPQNIGASKSIFRGYCEVRSPYALFLSDDDLMVGDYIAKCLEIFSNHDDVSVIHHEFDLWQKSENRYKEPYTIYPKGDDAIVKMFLLTGSYMGFALRMKNFLLHNFPLDKNAIYPQVKIANDMASKYNIATINDCGMIVIDFGDTLEDVKKRQNRPDSMGINERLSYAVELKNPLITQRLAFALARFAIRLFLEFEEVDTKRSKKFIKSLSFTLNNITPYLILHLFKIKKFNIAFYYLFRLILKPSFLINYTWFLLFVFKEIYSKPKRFRRFIFK
jgi:glycosyltransferase involved in cell wall biosynthesis